MDEVKVGDIVNCTIIDLDPDRRRISAGPKNSRQRKIGAKSEYADTKGASRNRVWWPKSKKAEGVQIEKSSKQSARKKKRIERYIQPICRFLINSSNKNYACSS